MNIRLIITAAGMSRRLPPNKLLEKRGEITALEKTVRSFLGFNLDMVVVIGFQAEKTRILLSKKFGEKIQVVLNNEYESGLASSLKAGLTAPAEKIDYYGFSLGDKPFIERKTIEYILDHLNRNKPKILIPAYHGHNGHPAFFLRNFKKDLMLLKGNMGARQIIRNLSSQVTFLPVPDRGIILDLDLYNRESNGS